MKGGKTMKAVLLFILVALCLTGKTQTSPETRNQPNWETNSSAFSGNGNISRVSEISNSFNTISQTPFVNSQQKNNYKAFLSAGFWGTSNGTIPFWMRSMQHGSIPSDGISLSLAGGAFKEYKINTSQQLMDWGAGFEGRFNAGNHTQFILIEAYAKVRLSIFELKGGRYRDQIGLVDSTLSTGAFSVSGNALGFPKIEAGIPHFWNVPLTKGVIAIKGNLAHGWAGTQTLKSGESYPVLVSEIDAYIHQLSAYGRIGKTNWKIKLYGGLNHMAMWGNEEKIFPGWDLSQFETFKYVVIGKAYGTASVPKSKIGNHLGTIDQAMEWKFKRVLLTGYHQFFYDVGALAKLANAKDGLWGISIKNQQTKTNGFHWNKFLLEFFNSKSQGGEIDSKPRTSGAENYYNNFLYYTGWTYKGNNIGSSLLTTKKYIKEGYPATPYQYFPNNRVVAVHGGTELQFGPWLCKGLLTYSLNYGTYSTSPAERRPPKIIVYHDPPYFPKIKQLSAFLESHRMLKNSFELGIQLAIDQGELLNNSIGGGISLTKHW
jgi:hypothetical protein